MNDILSCFELTPDICEQYNAVEIYAAKDSALPVIVIKKEDDRTVCRVNGATHRETKALKLYK